MGLPLRDRMHLLYKERSTDPENGAISTLALEEEGLCSACFRFGLERLASDRSIRRLPCLQLLRLGLLRRVLVVCCLRCRDLATVFPAWLKQKPVRECQVKVGELLRGPSIKALGQVQVALCLRSRRRRQFAVRRRDASRRRPASCRAGEASCTRSRPQAAWRTSRPCRQSSGPPVLRSALWAALGCSWHAASICKRARPTLFGYVSAPQPWTTPGHPALAEPMTKVRRWMRMGIIRGPDSESNSSVGGKDGR